jgi:hypothetical protein
VSTALGLVGVAFFIACTIGLAAGVTWLVVRLTPAPDPKPKTDSST